MVDKCAVSVFFMNRLVHAYQAQYSNQDLLLKVGIKVNAKDKIKPGFNATYRKYNSPLLSEALMNAGRGKFRNILKGDESKKGQ